MQQASTREIGAKVSQYLIMFAGVIAGLVIFGYMMQYSWVLYGDGEIGLSLQVLGLGLIIGAMMLSQVSMAISRGREQTSDAGGEGNPDFDTYAVIGGSLLVIAWCGVFLLVGGYYI